MSPKELPKVKSNVEKILYINIEEMSKEIMQYQGNVKIILRNIKAATRVSVDNSVAHYVPFLRRRWSVQSKVHDRTIIICLRFDWKTSCQGVLESIQ